MDWKEKIEEGMKLIKEGCAETEDNCLKCPFTNYCINFAEKDIPENWNEETI